jgi:hypothetical protein
MQRTNQFATPSQNWINHGPAAAIHNQQKHTGHQGLINRPHQNPSSTCTQMMYPKL